MPASRYAALLLMTALWCCAAADAVQRLPESIRKQLHRRSEYHVLWVKGSEPGTLLDRLPDHVKIVVWQALPEVTRTEDVQRVLRWVESGGVLWFQDSRLAPLFGMQADPVHRADLRNVKEHQGQYGAFKKLQGAATYAMAPVAQPHAVMTGVKGVQVFLLKVGEDQYSAVHLTPNLTPLLKLQWLPKRPLYEKVIAGLMQRGRGNIVFKPLIFDEVYSGARFQANLLEFSAGFPVPTDAPAQ